MVELVIIAASVFGFALVSARLAHSPLTGPMVFTTIGIVAGSAGLGWFDLDLEGEAVSILVEATLVLVLFTDAIRIDLRALRREAWLPSRLLGLGLPLTFLLGAAVAALLFGSFTWAEAALLAAILTPTDAALGQSVVSDRRLPVRLRQGLNVESGLNDGIMVPIVTVALAIAASEADSGNVDHWAAFATQQVGFGLLFGVGIGALGGRLLDIRSAAGRVDGIYRQLATLSIAAAAFGASETLGGNGFIAAFTAGLAFGYVAREQRSDVQDFSEDEGEVLTAITFVIFGAAFAGPALTDLTWQVAAYAVLSLTVVRMLPVLVALWRSGMLLETRLFAGWFGPRGLASILFALIVVDSLESPRAETVFLAATITILLSVYAHGLTASPWAGRLGRRLESAPRGAPEHAPAPEMPTRRGLLRAPRST